MALRQRPVAPESEHSRPGPLPWLPPVPTFTDPAWQQYLDARAEQIFDAADEVAYRAYLSSQPGSLLSRMDPGLLRELSIWHAVHDDRDTGLTERERGYALHLAERRRAVVGGHIDPGTRWAPLVHDIDPRILRDPQWPLLAATIEKAARIGHDPILILPRLLNDQPFPDSKIAAAAMYRLVHAIPEALPDSKPTRYEQPSPFRSYEPFTPAPDHGRGIGR